MSFPGKYTFLRRGAYSGYNNIFGIGVERRWSLMMINPACTQPPEDAWVYVAAGSMNGTLV